MNLSNPSNQKILHKYLFPITKAKIIEILLAIKKLKMLSLVTCTFFMHDQWRAIFLSSG